jgi:hypothetical protein
VARRPARKPEKQLYLPTSPPTTTRVLPMQLRIGDRLVDESGEWQVLAKPYTTAGGKSVNVRVQRADNSNVMAIRVWGAHEHISVKRASTEEGKR